MNRALAVAFASLAIVAAGCAGSEQEASTSSTSPSPSTTQLDPEPAVVSRFVDPSIEETMYEVSWDVPDDLEGLAAGSDQIIVGTIVGTTEAEFVAEASDEDPSGVVEEWDGIVFEVEDVLTGDLEVNDLFTVVHPAVMITPEGGTFRINVQPLDVLKPGIEAVGVDADALRFLLFSSRLEGEEFFVVSGPGSVVEVAPDGTLAVASVGALDARRPGGVGLTIEQLKTQL